jgi:hypothetical protein
MKFATNQPAPSGNIVLHCGGPGSISGCGIGMGSEFAIGKDNAANYNIIGIDQVRMNIDFLHKYTYHNHDDMYCCLTVLFCNTVTKLLFYTFY